MATGSSNKGEQPERSPGRSIGVASTRDSARAGEGPGASAHGSTPPDGTDSSLEANEQHQPEWANGLRQLYDSVVDEPLPDSFRDLLAQFDEVDDSGDDAESSETRH